ncbi:bifunctional diguanylate cyclase/phosphohydrolase [Paenibacillus typhae]|uniref:Diguanylate cyclase (GGDEF) domain-containing protein n=1 Tax=Paenibacillus typhae TaxID=1174501 RepID=A0A1G8KJ07_9BACL|nr:diguanylate cyclase [Paenibacillus typhae]SDI43392.1 diguanylate cyclase (GGDEF) domain-containing protein [Paenibacillus typhae]
MSKLKSFAATLDSGHMYALSVCLIGMGLFSYTNRFEFLHYSTSSWVWVYAMTSACLVLNFFMIQLPPEGNEQSLDSSVYLACIFIFGPGFTLTVLLLNCLFFAVIDRGTRWWKHLTNFFIYSIMIIASAAVFQYLGGSPGALVNTQLFTYLIVLAVYFFMNTLLVVLYYYILYRATLYETVKDMIKDAMFVYLCTLVLSLVLTVLVYHNQILGLLLFMCLAVLLCQSFKKLFSMYRSIEERANTDQRTGLFNHSYFEEVLEQEIQKSRSSGTPLSLAMIDLDDFKKYNDHFGHLQGDKLISFVGELLKTESRKSGTIAARYGGEEFTLLMPGYDSLQARTCIDQLRKKLNNSRFDGVEIFPLGCLAFSAGIAASSSDIHDKSQLVDHADQALYYSKRQGKNTVHTYGEHSPLEQELDFSQDVRDIEQQLNLFMYKDMETFRHSKRVFRYAMDISEILDMDAISKRNFTLGALIHDIGKLEIPWSILNKTDKLAPEEWEMVKWHVTWGKKMALTNDKFKELAPYIELHHERYDGKGYPYGFKGEEIPRLCRMLTIIDSFDAMTTERPYQPTKSFEEAVIELRACAGSQFDPELTELFINYIESREPRPENEAM